jgi:hypothetical protein
MVMVMVMAMAMVMVESWRSMSSPRTGREEESFKFCSIGEWRSCLLLIFLPLERPQNFVVPPSRKNAGVTMITSSCSFSNFTQP